MTRFSFFFVIFFEPWCVIEKKVYIFLVKNYDVFFTDKIFHDWADLRRFRGGTESALCVGVCVGGARWPISARLR